MRDRRLARCCCLASLLWFAHVTSAWSAPSLAPPNGIRENTPTVHALLGARIVAAPGRVIEKGTIVIRDGLIAAVGADVPVPPDARVWNMEGKTIYAGLFDAYSELSSAGGDSPSASAARYWNSNVLPETRADQRYTVDEAANRKLRSQGITVRLVAPADGLIKGSSSLVSTGDAAAQQAIIKPKVAMHLRLMPSRAGRDSYPNSPMGAVALVRQVFYDADWYHRAWEAFETQQGVPRPERSESLEALQQFIGNGLPIVIDAPDELYALRANRVATEFGLHVIIRGSGNEYRRLEAIRDTGRPVIVPLDFPKAPDVRTPESAMSAGLTRLLHWDLAPENPGRLDQAGVRIALSTIGLKDPGTFLSAVRKAVRRGLSAEAALRALTTTPAALWGVESQLGTIDPGKLAHLVVADGDLFSGETKVVETWIDGRRYEQVKQPALDVRGTWELSLTQADGSKQTVTIELEGKLEKLTGKLKRDDKEAKLSQVSLDDARLTFSAKGDDLGWPGVMRLSVAVKVPPEGAATWLGNVVYADGTTQSCTATRTNLPKAAEPGETPQGDKPEDAPDAAPATGEAPQSAVAAEDGEAKEQKPKEPDHALFAVNYPLGAYGLTEPPPQPKAVLFRDATVWTSSPQGVLEHASVLVVDGKIAAVGTDVQAPDDAQVIDLAGKHLTPGLIDCHSHIATDGGVNESGQAITAEVRIGDFIDANDINIYRQLAGGVTSSNILHGSANPIGGQNQVIKMRWGALPEEIKFAAAPQGIKFALGENVKQSNWGERFTTRYPQSRMGVEQIVRDEFQAALEYKNLADAWQRNPSGLPPRIDLELEAIKEVLDGTRLIHCHSYRQDEILALLRTCEAYGVRIATLQHILEGYKLADQMNQHGAGGSTFSDWWAYKFEVFDAIPYNGALMHNAGVIVSFNSDDAELARRLYLEAAKAVKYGGIPPAEALKFVTLNPAIQLHINDRVGSLEPGKDADLVIWSGSPLSGYSHCEQTWIDGRKYFDRADDLARRDAARQMKAALVQRILASNEPVEGPDEVKLTPAEMWPREDLFCHRHGDHEEAE